MSDELSSGNPEDIWELPPDEWTPRPGDPNYERTKAVLISRIDQARKVLREPANRVKLARFMLRKAKTNNQKLLKLAVGLAISTFMLPEEQ